MKKLISAVVGIFLAVSIVSVAGAAPFAGHAGTAQFATQIKGSDGHTYQVTVDAYKDEAGPTWVSVAVQKCKGYICAAPVNYVKTLTADEFTVAPDSTTASLDTTLGGAPLKIDWTDGSGVNAMVTAGDDGGTV